MTMQQFKSNRSTRDINDFFNRIHQLFIKTAFHQYVQISLKIFVIVVNFVSGVKPLANTGINIYIAMTNLSVDAVAGN